MPSLSRRVAVLEALAQPRPAQPCILVYQYRGETLADALQAEGHERESPGRLVIVFRRDFCRRDASLGDPR